MHSVASYIELMNRTKGTNPMQLTLDFAAGTPDIPTGAMRYYFVRQRSPYDHKIRVVGAYYLNEYLLDFEDNPCPQCPYPDGEQDCPGANGDGCPVTGWFDEKWHPGYDSVYQRLEGEILAFASPPEPTT